MPPKKLTGGSLFSGIGGMDLGFERAGIEVIWQCEIDEFCRQVLKRHWPNVPCYSDIKEIDHDTPKVDILFGGFPCQPVSTAGRRKAQADSRWLWPEFARVIGILRPRYVVVENVPGLRTAGMGFVLADLSTLGYDAEWDGVSAAGVGAPHLRERVFIVAYRCGRRRQDNGLQAGRAQPGGGGAPHGALADAGSTAGSAAGSASPAVFQPRTLERLGRCGSGMGDAWPALSHLDGTPHGPACGMDGVAGWECGTPRTLRGQRDRVNRLRAIGNAVVPQVAEFVASLVVEDANAS